MSCLKKSYEGITRNYTFENDKGVKLAMRRSIFSSDSRYRVSLDKYNQVDGIFAILYYVLLMVAYYLMGVIYAKKNIYLGYQVSLVLVIIIISYLVIKKQSVESVGFGKGNIKKSIILGTAAAGIVFLINFIPGVVSGKELNSASKLLSNFIYYLFVIALVEEIVFRGFIQTRIYGIIKRSHWAIFIVAFMFMSMHIPFQMGRTHMDFLTFIANNYLTLIFQFSWHIIFNLMYTKYNSIAAPTIFHTIMNWSNYLFI